MRISDWSSDVCSSDLRDLRPNPDCLGQEGPRSRGRERTERFWRRSTGIDNTRKINTLRGLARSDSRTPSLSEVRIQPPVGGLGKTRREIGRAHVELQSLMRRSYAVFSLHTKTTRTHNLANTTC